MTGDLPFFRNALLVLIILPLGHVWGPFKASSFFSSEIKTAFLSIWRRFHIIYLLGKVVIHSSCLWKNSFLAVTELPSQEEAEAGEGRFECRWFKTRRAAKWPFLCSVIGVNGATTPLSPLGVLQSR